MNRLRNRLLVACACAVAILLLGYVARRAREGGEAQTANAEGEKPRTFDPKLKLKWPGKPHESNGVYGEGDDVHKNYNAMYTEKQDKKFTLYAAFVDEFSDQHRKAMSPKELLANFTAAFKERETSRKEIQYGAKKYPGLEISARAKGRFERRLVVMVLSRIYTLSVSASTEDDLKAPAVKAFFDSFKPDD
jgi:hypothetical protein